MNNKTPLGLFINMGLTLVLPIILMQFYKFEISDAFFDYPVWVIIAVAAMYCVVLREAYKCTSYFWTLYLHEKVASDAIKIFLFNVILIYTCALTSSYIAFLMMFHLQYPSGAKIYGPILALSTMIILNVFSFRKAKGNAITT